MDRGGLWDFWKYLDDKTNGSAILWLAWTYISTLHLSLPRGHRDLGIHSSGIGFVGQVCSFVLPLVPGMPHMPIENVDKVQEWRINKFRQPQWPQVNSRWEPYSVFFNIWLCVSG